MGLTATERLVRLNIQFLYLLGLAYERHTRVGRLHLMTGSFEIILRFKHFIKELGNLKSPPDSY